MCVCVCVCENKARKIKNEWHKEIMFIQLLKPAF